MRKEKVLERHTRKPSKRAWSSLERWCIWLTGSHFTSTSI